MCDMDVGVHIDMVDPATYKISEEPVQVCIFCFIKLCTRPLKNRLFHFLFGLTSRVAM